MYEAVMVPNWFLAFPVDADWCLDLPPPPPRFRAFQAADLHLTLTFLGPCGEPAALAAFRAIADALDASPCAQVRVTFGEVVPMGPVDQYTAVSATLKEGRDLMTGLLRELRDAPADAAGVRRDQRAPLPHVTLARPQRRANEEDRREGLAWAKSLVLPSHVHVLDRIALYTWHSEREHSLFRVVDQVHLS